MLPCEDCKVRTLVNNQTVGLMLNQGHLLITGDAFSGSSVSGAPVGIDLSDMALATNLVLVDSLSDVNLAADNLSNDDTGTLDLEFRMAKSFDERLDERRFVIINEL